MKIIDGRAFVPYQDMGKTSFFQDLEKRSCIAREKYNSELPLSVQKGSMDFYLAEMKAEKIVKAIVPARLAAARVNNETLVKLLAQYPDTFIGFAAVEGGNSKNALDDIEHYVVNGPCLGVVMEPGCENEKIAVHDERLYPIYHKCQERNIPLYLGFGGMLYSDFEQYKPIYLEKILHQFPKLKICALHGGWPYAAEMLWLALMNANFYLMPDVYMCGAPFSKEYAAAANTLIKDKIIFASCYPVISQKEAVSSHLACGINESVWENVFYKNACKFCGIDI